MFCNKIKKSMFFKEKLKMEDIQMSKRYIYLALDKEGKPLLSKNNDLIFSPITQEECEKPNWRNLGLKEIDYNEITTSDYFRADLDESDGNKEEKKKTAKSKLTNKYNQYLKEKGTDMSDIETANLTDTVDKNNTIEVCVANKIDTIKKAICRNITNSTEKVCKGIANSKKAICGDIADSKETICKDIANSCDDLVETIKLSAQENRENFTNTIKTATDVASKMQDDQEQIISKIKSINKNTDKIEELCETTETIEGKLSKLEKLDEIISILSEKGVEITREFPPTCNEEEDIINLVRYSKKITEQLGYAARDLIRKKAVYENKEQSIANEQQIIENKIKNAYDKGKKHVIKALLEKYDNVDDIINSETGYVHVIWTLLKELGVDYDGDGHYKKGEIINLGEEEINNMAAIYSKFDGAGEYRVVSSGLVYAGEIVFKAEFEKIADSQGIIEQKQDEETEANLQEQDEESKADSPEQMDN